MKQSIFAILLGTLILSACGKQENGTASTDANGFCTRDFILSYNDVVRKFKAYQTAYTAVPLNENAVAEAALDLSLQGKNFLSKYEGTTCEANKFEANEIHQVKETDLMLNVESATNVMRLRKSGTPIPQKPSDVFNGTEKLFLIDVSAGVAI